ncbi:MAG: transcriptional regulator [Candidatus Levybacteria bacterium RBG_16_35_11]|nr:MAG: transcriptional regulator [Candidatus Levybacteria bacterium RBG_16_35_11]
MIKPQDRKHLSFDVWKKELLKDPAFKREYERLQPEFAVISAIIEARVRKGITQAELAKKMKTKQSAIARLESGTANPSILFLKKLAAALNMNLQIKFTSL